jgi:hypothetical protein
VTAAVNIHIAPSKQKTTWLAPERGAVPVRQEKAAVAVVETSTPVHLTDLKTLLPKVSQISRYHLTVETLRQQQNH